MDAFVLPRLAAGTKYGRSRHGGEEQPEPHDRESPIETWSRAGAPDSNPGSPRRLWAYAKEGAKPDPKTRQHRIHSEAADSHRNKGNSNQLIRRDRQIPNPFARCMEDCVADGRPGPGNSNLPYTPGTHGVQLVIRNIERGHIDLRNVGVYRNMISGEV